MIRTLVVTPTIVYPPMSGAPLRSWQHINILAQLGPVGMFSVGSEATPVTSPPQLSFWTHHLLDPNRPVSAAQSLLRLTRPQQWWVYPHFHSLVTPGAIANLQNILDTFQPDVVILDRAQLYGYVPMLCENAIPVIWDTHNIQSSLVAEMKSALGIRSSPLSALALQSLRKVERGLSAQAAQVWVCSDDDARRLARVGARTSDVRVIPNAIDLAFYASVRESANNSPPPPGPHVLFVGVLSYEPNRIAGEFLLEKIYPTLRSILPHARCTIVGRNPSRSMLDAALRDSSITLPGAVEDVRPYLTAADVVVVPLMQGGGTRLKILEAFAAERPVVSTTKGNEGLRSRSGEHLLLADDPQSMVAAIARLWLDARLRKSLTQAAYALVANEYSWSAVSALLRSAVEQCVANSARKLDA